MIDSALGQISRLVTNRPTWVLCALAAISLVAALLLPHLRIDPEITAFLPQSDERVELLTQDSQAGTTGRRLWIALEGAGVEEQVGAIAEALAEVEGVERILVRREELLGMDNALPNLARLSVDALAALEQSLEPKERRAAVADIRRVLAEDPIGGQERVLRDPLGLRWVLNDARQARLPLSLKEASTYLVTKDGGLAILALEGTRAPFDVAFSVALMGAVEAVLQEHGFDGQENAHLIGGYAAARGDSTRIKADLMRSLAWSLPLVMLFLMVSSRSFVLPHLYLIPVLIANLWALGFGSALLGPLTPLALSSAAILTGLGVDFAIHLAERWREERGQASAARAALISTVETGRGLVAGMLTSGAAFMAFSVSSLPGLVSFGALLTLGLGSALVVTLLLEPILLERFARGTISSSGAGGRGPRPSPLVRAAQVFSAGPYGLAGAGLLILAATIGWGAFTLRGLHFSADPAALRPDGTGLARAARAIEQRLDFSPIPLRVLLPDDPEGLPTMLDRLNVGAAQLTRTNQAALVLGPHDIVPGSEKRKRLAALRGRASSLVAEVSADLRAEGLRPAPFQDSLNELAESMGAEPPDDAPSFRITTGTGSDAKTWWRVDVYATGDLSQSVRREELHAAVQKAFGEEAMIADPHGIGDIVTPILRRELFSALLRASCLVALFVVVGIGSLRHGLLALLPVLLGFGITLGLLSLFGVSLTPGNLMAIPLILGLGVDDGVHLVLRRKQGGRALLTTGNAIWRTSATTALGFGSLITAQTPAIASLGAITLIGVAATLMTSLFVLPAFWSRSDRRARKEA